MDIKDLDTITKPQKALNGFIEEVSLSDLVQIACLSRLERRLVIKKDGETGEIFFANGEVVHAKLGDKVGPEAFYELFALQPATFLMLKETCSQKTIDIPWNFLLMEAFRIADESKHLGLKERDEGVKKVMIVDDSRIVGKIMTGLLHDELGVETVILAKSGKDALELMEQHRPDFITLDINMTILGGGENIKYLMVRSPSPVFIMSGLTQESFPRIMEFFRLGALDYIPKPRDYSLIPAIKKRLKKHIESIKKYEITNFKRSKITLSSIKKISSNNSAKKLILIIGGTGAFMDLQRLLPSLIKTQETFLLILQDMDKSLIPYMATFFNQISNFHVKMPAKDIAFYEGQCVITNWEHNIEILPTPELVEAKFFEDTEIDINKLLISLSDIYGPNMYIIVLSGASLNMKDGLDEVILRGTHIILQDPKTALAPEPIKVIASQEQEEVILNIDAIPDFLGMRD